MPKVSVIIPAYNAGKYLKEAVESILYQTFKDFELIIINDGSTDNTGEIMRSFRDSRIVYIENSQNMGFAFNVNRAVSESKGEYLARMDADDSSRSGRFEKQVKFLDSNPGTGICGAWINVRTMGKPDYINRYPVTAEEVRFAMLSYNPLPHPALMLRKSIFVQNGLFFDSKYWPADDYELWSRAVRYFDAVNLPEVLLDYRMHPDNATTTKDEIRQRHTDEIRVNQLRYLTGKMKESEEQCYIKLLKKEPKKDSYLYIEAAEVLESIIKADAEKNIYGKKYIVPFVRECWSYACKTGAVSLKNYNEGLKKMGLKTGIDDSALQFLKTIKFYIKKGGFSA